MAALRSNDVESFRARLRDLDVLLLEDVHFLQGKEKMQDMVLTVIKSLQDRGGRAIFTSSFSPRELEKLDSQLVSHFCSGIVSPLERPDTEMCRHILERKAKSFQVLLPDEVCDLLAGRLQGDVRQLESCLKSLVFKARMLNCGLNPELALEVLQQYATVDCGPDFASIVRLVCESYGLNERQLASRSHKQQYVLARNTIYYLARKHTDMSLKEIGERFNRRHSTVIKGITSLEREIANESRVGRQISRAVELIERNAGIRPEMSLGRQGPCGPSCGPQPAFPVNDTPDFCEGRTSADDLPFCCLREGQPVPSGPIPAHRCCGSGSPDTGKGRGGCRGRFAGHGAVIAPGAVSRCFRLWNGRNPAWMAWLFSYFCCPDSGVAASSVLGRCPFVAFLFRPLRGMFPLSCIPRCAAGDLWKVVRKQKGPPARSRWPLISRREAAAYSPATAFWCSAMTLSATGWGASS